MRQPEAAALGRAHAGHRPDETSALCTPIQRRKPPALCAFGAGTGKAVETVALVGDSHAVQWRAALQPIAKRRRWHALTVYRSSCPFTRATTDLPQPARSQCVRWGEQVVRWFRKRAAIRTVFVAERSRAGVIVPHGRDKFAARVAGFAAAWKALPRTVKHIVVIRDPPYVATDTLACVRRAMVAHKPAGIACSLPRSVALKPDPAAVAVARLASPRVQLVDLTPFMCDDASCFPVVGGALVKKDMGHLTRLFAGTLSPYLDRALERLMQSW